MNIIQIKTSKKVLVTGANGFLGSWIVKGLVQEGHEVFAFVRRGSDLSELIGVRCQFRYGDITDESSVAAAAAGCDSIFHLAGLISYKRSELQRMELINIKGTAHILKAMQINSVRRLVHFSSVAAIGAGLTSSEILNEESVYNLAPYKMGYFDTKHAAEILVKAACEKHGLDAVIVNPSTVYGAGDALKGSRKMQVKVARGKLPFYTPGGVNVLGVEDLVNGVISAWEKGRRGERYILSGDNLLIKDLFALIAESAGKPPPRFLIPAAVMLGLGQIGDWIGRGLSKDNAYSSCLFHFFSNEKARSELQFDPRPAKEAIQKSVLWMREHQMLEP